MRKYLTRAQHSAYEKLNINPGHRVIFSIDGGGVRGILTLQLLKKIEEIAGMKICQFCDLCAGTSTGGIIAGLLACGYSASAIEKLYIQLVRKVFHKRSPVASRFFNPPRYTKDHFREALKTTLGDLTLEAACLRQDTDLFITAKDITDNEETFFTCFNRSGTRGTYRHALLRTVMEATMSAPTYFNPLERFIDGGTTAYNNPSLAALMEAVRYDGRGKYQLPEVTLFSFGTGKRVQSVSPEQAAHPAGIDALFWLDYLMDESGQDASAMQSDLLRSGMIGLDYRRFQLSFDRACMQKLPDRDLSGIPGAGAAWLRDLQDKDFRHMEMDDVSQFELMRCMGEAMTAYIMEQNRFRYDLNHTPTQRDELVTAFENTGRIRTITESADWISKYRT